MYIVYPRIPVFIYDVHGRGGKKRVDVEYIAGACIYITTSTHFEKIK